MQFARNKAGRVLAHLAETVLHCSKVGKVGRGSQEEKQFSEGAHPVVPLQCDLDNYGFSSECDDVFQVYWFRVFDWKFLCVHLCVRSGGVGAMWRRSVGEALGCAWGQHWGEVLGMWMGH